MNFVSKKYKKAFLHRYDRDGIIPYLSNIDFPGLKMEEYHFNNSQNINISYYVYYYANYKNDKVILFCPGIGPGHVAYIREINSFCSRGYKVITLDYTGTGNSGGDSLYSFNAPTRDIIDLLNYLKLKEEIIIIGHSLGGYSALNTINLRNDIHKAVIISGFLSIYLEFKAFYKAPLILQLIKRYEMNNDKQYGKINNIKYLKHTNDNLLFIQSKDDQKVPYKYALGLVNKINNPNITKLTVDHKDHNPTYTIEAVKYMNNAFNSYAKKVKDEELKTFEEKRDYVSQFSALKMTEQDEEIINAIISYIETH